MLPGPLGCDLEEESWTACLADTACATQWFLSVGDAAEREVFDYLLARYVVLELQLGAPVASDACAGQPLEPLWLPLLRQARHCPPNEEPDPVGAASGGCRCRSDRQCHEDPPRTVVMDVLGFTFLAMFAIGAFVYYAANYTYSGTHGGTEAPRHRPHTPPPRYRPLDDKLGAGVGPGTLSLARAGARTGPSTVPGTQFTQRR